MGRDMALAVAVATALTALAKQGGQRHPSRPPSLISLSFKLIIHRRPKIQGSREHFFRLGASFRTGSVELGGEMECARGSAKLGRRLKS